MEVRPACPASWPCPSTNHPRAIGNRGSPAGSAGYSKQDLNRSNTKSPWSANRGDRTYKEGVGGSSPSAPTRNVEKPGRFAALEAVGECPCRALSLSFHGRSAQGPWFAGGVPVRLGVGREGCPDGRRLHRSLAAGGGEGTQGGRRQSLGRRGLPGQAGQPVLELHAEEPALFDAAREALRDAIDVVDEAPVPQPLIVDRIEA